MRADVEHVRTPPELSWAYREFRQQAFDFSWHLHAEHELTLITYGTGTRIVGTSIESYRRHDLVLIGPEVPHAYVSTPGTDRHEAIVIQFGRDFLGADFFSRPEFAAAGQLLATTAGAVVFDAPLSMTSELGELPARSPAEQTLALVRLLVGLGGETNVRHIGAERRVGTLSQPARRRADAVCNYLQRAYARRVSLAEVAAVAHLSPPALSRFFRHALGRTVTEYVTELRIAAACQLLSDSDLPVAAIAARCGYDNLSNFNRRFRLLKGMTPREYRGVMAGPVPHPTHA